LPAAESGVTLVGVPLEVDPAVWLEPVRGGYPDLRLLGLSGEEQMAAFLGGRAPRPPIHHLTGMMPTEGGGGASTFTMPATPWLQAPQGPVLPGALVALADGPLGMAVQSALPPMTPYTTAEISMNYVRPVPADGGTLVARGRLILAGRSLGLSETLIEDGRGRIVAHGTSRCVIFDPLGPPPDPPPELDPVPAPEHPTPDPYLRPAAGAVIPQETWDSSSGLEVLSRHLAGELPAPPIAHLTGLRPTAASEGMATFVLPASEWLCSPLGRVEGGMIAMLADTVILSAVQTTIPAGTSFAPLDLKVNFLRPVSPDGRDVTGRGTIVHRGRTMAVGHADLTDADGKRVAIATGTVMILPDRPWQPQSPVVPLDESGEGPAPSD